MLSGVFFIARLKLQFGGLAGCLGAWIVCNTRESIYTLTANQKNSHMLNFERQ